MESVVAPAAAVATSSVSNCTTWHGSACSLLTALCVLLAAAVLLQSFSSPGVFVSTFGITALALASAFLA